MTPKWIFFDLGWTLVDETEAHRARLADTSRQLGGLGRAYSVDQLMALCRQAATGFAPSPFHGMLAGLGLPDVQLADIKRSVRYAKENERLYPGVPELLASLAARFRIGVIANQTEGTEKRLTKWGIRDAFSLVFASTELGLSKPDPQIFAAALDAAGCNAAEAVMVGDRLDNDIAPAKAQGWRTVRVRQGFSRLQSPRGPHEIPDEIVAHIQDLSAVELG